MSEAGPKERESNALMPAAEVAVVVRDGEEVVDVALGRERRPSLVGERRRKKACEIETREGVLHLCLDLRRARSQRIVGADSAAGR